MLKMCLRENFKTFLFVLVVLNLKSFVFSQCKIRLSEDPKLRPNIFLSIGSRKVYLKLNKAYNFVSIFDQQNIEVQCNTEFQYPEYIKKENKIELKCRGNSLCDGYDYSCYPGKLFECSPKKWNLYETFQNFVWCPQNTSSYLLARPGVFNSTRLQYLAGVCYDTHNISFKSLYYTISLTNSENLYPTVLTDFYTPSLEIKHFSEIFGDKIVLESDYNNQDFKDWIQFAKYNYSSIVQNTLLLSDFNDQLGSLLDLAWWPNLRLGNWKRYETALKNHVENGANSYDVLAGVSKVVNVPIIQACQTNFTMRNLIDSRNNKIPLYIWNYLRSTNNSSDEIVIIGVNTPFYEFYSESDIVFCQDKCKEISWLKKFSSTFRYSPMGVMFCCSSEDVKLSKCLDGFPDIDFVTKPEITDDITINPMLQYENVNPMSQTSHENEEVAE